MVVVKETWEKGQVPWKAVGAVWGDEAADEVAERRLLVRWVQDLDSKTTRRCARNRVILLRNWFVAEHLALVFLGAQRLYARPTTRAGLFPGLRIGRSCRRRCKARRSRVSKMELVGVAGAFLAVSLAAFARRLALVALHSMSPHFTPAGLSSPRPPDCLFPGFA
jgi:hypothetical protein